MGLDGGSPSHNNAIRMGDPPVPMGFGGGPRSSLGDPNRLPSTGPSSPFLQATQPLEGEQQHLNPFAMVGSDAYNVDEDGQVPDLKFTPAPGTPGPSVEMQDFIAQSAVKDRNAKRDIMRTMVTQNDNILNQNDKIQTQNETVLQLNQQLLQQLDDEVPLEQRIQDLCAKADASAAPRPRPTTTRKNLASKMEDVVNSPTVGQAQKLKNLADSPSVDEYTFANAGVVRNRAVLELCIVDKNGKPSVSIANGKPSVSIAVGSHSSNVKRVLLDMAKTAANGRVLVARLGPHTIIVVDGKELSKRGLDGSGEDVVRVLHVSDNPTVDPFQPIVKKKGINDIRAYNSKLLVNTDADGVSIYSHFAGSFTPNGNYKCMCKISHTEIGGSCLAWMGDQPFGTLVMTVVPDTIAKKDKLPIAKVWNVSGEGQTAVQHRSVQGDFCPTNNNSAGAWSKDSTGAFLSTFDNDSLASLTAKSMDGTRSNIRRHVQWEDRKKNGGYVRVSLRVLFSMKLNAVRQGTVKSAAGMSGQYVALLGSDKKTTWTLKVATLSADGHEYKEKFVSPLDLSDAMESLQYLVGGSLHSGGNSFVLGANERSLIAALLPLDLAGSDYSIIEQIDLNNPILGMAGDGKSSASI
ncbi:MAG: hypothetical protein SGARI_002556, partial [Bacillariaceae sp.]